MLLENGNDVDLSSLINKEVTVRDLNGDIVNTAIIARLEECLTCDIGGHTIDLPLDVKTAIYVSDQSDKQGSVYLQSIKVGDLYKDFLNLKENSLYAAPYPEVACVSGGTIRLRFLNKGTKIFFWPQKKISFSHFGAPFYC